MRTRILLAAASLIATAGCAMVDDNAASKPKPMRYAVVVGDYRSLSECLVQQYSPSTSTFSPDEPNRTMKVVTSTGGMGITDIIFREAGLHRTAIEIRTGRSNPLMSDQRPIAEAWDKISSCLAQAPGQGDSTQR